MSKRSKNYTVMLTIAIAPLLVPGFLIFVFVVVIILISVTKCLPKALIERWAYLGLKFEDAVCH